jgi:hypothetical protein
MEINSKHLHKHSLPVILLLVGLLIISAMSFAGTNTTLEHDLVQLTFTVPPPAAPPNLAPVGRTAARDLGSN